MLRLKTIRMRVIPVQCGIPPQDSEYEDEYDVPAFLITSPYMYVMFAEGDSMEPTIMSGELVIVEAGVSYRHGSLVVVQMPVQKNYSATIRIIRLLNLEKRTKRV
jgi:SOS-response transcriptional repressor LexA